MLMKMWIRVYDRIRHLLLHHRRRCLLSPWNASCTASWEVILRPLFATMMVERVMNLSQVVVGQTVLISSRERVPTRVGRTRSENISAIGSIQEGESVLRLASCRVR